MEKVIQKLLERFNQEYNFLYENGDSRVVGYREALEYGDFLINAHAKIVDMFVSFRQDVLSSDREVAAFGFAVNDLANDDDLSTFFCYE